MKVIAWPARQRAGQPPKNFHTIKIFLPKIPGLGVEVFPGLHPFRPVAPVGSFRPKDPRIEGRNILLVGRFSKPQKTDFRSRPSRGRQV